MKLMLEAMLDRIIFAVFSQSKQVKKNHKHTKPGDDITDDD